MGNPAYNWFRSCWIWGIKDWALHRDVECLLWEQKLCCWLTNNHKQHFESALRATASSAWAGLSVTALKAEVPGCLHNQACNNPAPLCTDIIREILRSARVLQPLNYLSHQTHSLSFSALFHSSACLHLRCAGTAPLKAPRSSHPSTCSLLCLQTQLLGWNRPGRWVWATKDEFCHISTPPFKILSCSVQTIRIIGRSKMTIHISASCDHSLLRPTLFWTPQKPQA